MFLYDVNLQNLTTKESRRNFLDLLNILNESDINLVPFHRQDIKLNNLVKIWPRKKVDRFQKVFKSRKWNDFLLLSSFFRWLASLLRKVASLSQTQLVWFVVYSVTKSTNSICPTCKKVAQILLNLVTTNHKLWQIHWYDKDFIKKNVSE